MDDVMSSTRMIRILGSPECLSPASTIFAARARGIVAGSAKVVDLVNL